MIPVRDCSAQATKSWVMIEYPLINLKMCRMTHQFIGSTRIVSGTSFWEWEA
jgi:hypothetical protein